MGNDGKYLIIQDILSTPFETKTTTKTCVSTIHTKSFRTGADFSQKMSFNSNSSIQQKMSIARIKFCTNVNRTRIGPVVNKINITTVYVAILTSPVGQIVVILTPATCAILVNDSSPMHFLVIFASSEGRPLGGFQLLKFIQNG